MDTQISAFVSEETKELLERFVRASGTKKGHVVEQALRHHLQALRELPADAIARPRIVVSRATLEAIAGRIERPRRPSRALRDLMAENGD